MDQDSSELLDDDDWDDQTFERTYVIFELASEFYAVPIQCVGEIIRLPEIIPVPDLPPYICGAANLRGSVVPVVDVRVRFGLPAVERHHRQVLILVEQGDELAALLVDAVRDAIEIHEEQIQRRTGVAADRECCVRGLARRDERHVDIVLNVPDLLGLSSSKGSDDDTRKR